MTTPSIPLFVSSAVVAVVMSTFASSARAQSCANSSPVRKGSWVLDVSYQQDPAAVHALEYVEYVVTRVEHMAGAAGDITVVTGRAAIKDGTSNTVFFAEKTPAVLSCDDVNQDGLAGISVVQFSLRDARGTVVRVTVIPYDGELDRSGEEAVTIVIGGRAVTGSARVWEWEKVQEISR